MARYVELRRHTDNDCDALTDEGVRAALEMGRPPTGSRTAILGGVDRQEYDALDRVARQIIDASRRGLDADVSNLIDSGLEISPRGLAYALAS
jgi:hypothetical protein